jgi:hypothetical protein
VVESHSTDFTEARGCFPLCEYCWKSLTPEQRLPYYAQLHNIWLTQSLPNHLAEVKDEWPLIEKAVLEGK